MKKTLKAYFHKITTHKDEIYNFLDGFDMKKKPASEQIGDFYYYISDVQKEEVEVKTGVKTNMLLFTLSKSDTNEQIKIDNVKTQKRRTVDKDENEGLGKDAYFCLIGDILVQRKSRSVATIGNLTDYLLAKLALAAKEIDIELVLEKDVYEKFGKVNIFKDFRFKIAAPKNLNLFADNSDDELAKLKLANDFNADTLSFEVKSKSLNKSKIQEIINIFQKNLTSAEFKSLSAIGENEFLDFVKYKLFYSDEIEIDKII